MVARIVSAVILTVVAVALVFFGVGFGGFAIWAAITPSLGEAWASAITALIFLIIPLMALLVLSLRRPKSFGRRLEEGAPLAAVFAGLASKPLIALAAAALFGAADYFLKRRK